MNLTPKLTTKQKKKQLNFLGVNDNLHLTINSFSSYYAFWISNLCRAQMHDNELVSAPSKTDMEHLNRRRNKNTASIQSNPKRALIVSLSQLVFNVDKM